MDIEKSVLDILINFGGLGVLAVFAVVLLRSTLSHMTTLLQIQKDLATAINNHLMELLKAQQLQNATAAEMLSAIKTFTTGFQEHMVEFERHRSKSEG